MSNKHDDAIKIFGMGFVALIILMCIIASWLTPKEKPNYPFCDYCKIGQKDAKPFPCRQCGKTHISCGRESGLRAFDARKDKEGVALGRSIKVCPDIKEVR